MCVYMCKCVCVSVCIVCMCVCVWPFSPLEYKLYEVTYFILWLYSQHLEQSHNIYSMHICILLNDSTSLGTSAIQSSCIHVSCPYNRTNREGIELQHQKFSLKDFNQKKSQLLAKDTTDIRSTSSFPRALCFRTFDCCNFGLALLLFLHGVNVFLTYLRDQACHLF